MKSPRRPTPQASDDPTLRIVLQSVDGATETLDFTVHELRTGVTLESSKPSQGRRR